MGKITELRNGKSRNKRTNIFLDGNFAFSLNAEIVARENLQIGLELSASRITELTGSNQAQICLDAATRYLGYRPRSEAELRQKLRQRGFDSTIIETVIAKLKEQKYVDDLAFARFWKDDRESFSPRSQWLTRRELRQKGVSEEIINQVVETIDEEDSAYRAALSKSRRRVYPDHQIFRRRLGEYLRRRGFGYEVTNRTVERLWQERNNST